MNKTVTANISGVVFHIEVDAYEKLNSYLTKIKSYFQNSSESEEIMADIESRIAELFASKMSDVNQVIRNKEVDAVIEIMGRPEQYVQDEDAENEKGFSSNQSESKKSKKRLFRDPDDRILGGVCSGIAHYVGLDPIWIRLLFIIIFIAGGSGLPIYIILWIIMPEAKTAAEKLQMKGEPVNIDSIGRAFEEGAKNVNEKIKNMDSSDFGQKVESFFEKVFHVLGTLISGFLKFFGKILGVALFVLGILLAFSMISGMLSTDAVIFAFSPEGIMSIESSELFQTLIMSEQQFTIAKYILIILIGVPIIALIFGGVKLLFNIKNSYGTGTALGILWLIALGASIIMGIQVGSEFKAKSRINEYINLESNYDSYVLTMEKENIPGDELIRASNEDFILSLDKGKIYYGLPELTIIRSYKDSLQLRVEKISRGSSKRTSVENAKGISYSVNQQGELLTFDSYMSFDRQQKIRGQEVELTLLLPVGKSVYLDESLRDLIFDIDNVTNTWDGEMLGKTWIMLEEGLTCLDCADIEGVKSEDIEKGTNK